MCGIVGYTGNKPAEKVLLDGLKRLEYRGYDSAGFSLAGDHKLLTVKAVGKVKNLEDEAQKYGELKPDIAARTIEGRELMVVGATTAPLTRLRFTANALDIRSVRANGAAALVERNDAGLFVVLPRAVAPGQRVKLEITYAGAAGKGLTIADDALYTSYFTCSWMLCDQDRPGDKARFSVRLDLPRGWTSFVADPRGENSAHLFGFAAGRNLTLLRQRAGHVEIVTASPHLSRERLGALFAETPAMVSFFEEKAGVPFPHARFWQFAPPGDEAQEGAGFSILGEDAVKSALDTPPDDWAIAHELSHQYWGNLVTCRDWTQFWLNEAFAVFMTAAWKQHRWGEAAYQEEITRAQRRWDGARERGWDRPLAFTGVYPDLRTRRAIQYSKGMLLLVELRGALGEEAFWNGLRAYTRTHAGGVVESADLQRALEASSGRDLSALFKIWVYE